jgi:hypothetical protein
MPSKPPKVEDEPGAKERFDRAIKNALAMPPKPHRAPPKAARIAKPTTRK